MACYICQWSAALLSSCCSTAQIFSAVLRKYFSGTSADVLLLLARAFYDAEQMPQARQALLRAVHLDPTNMQLRFNVALVLQVPPLLRRSTACQRECCLHLGVSLASIRRPAMCSTHSSSCAMSAV